MPKVYPLLLFACGGNKSEKSRANGTEDILFSVHFRFNRSDPGAMAGDGSKPVIHDTVLHGHSVRYHRSGASSDRRRRAGLPGPCFTVSLDSYAVRDG